jgi:steroid 5-alpha reductase family enzyme
VGELLINLAISAGAVVVLLGVVFAVSVNRDRHDLIDTAWGLGFALIAVVSLLLSPDPHPLIVGDWRLSRFKGDPANKGKLMMTGLWRYTRHPNYFGDAAVWTALYLLSCSTWPAAATILSPVVMIWLLVNGSGKPLTEKHMRKTRPEYADYVARTSGFFPLPQKAAPRN